jgi:hypothetical protein
MQITPTYHAFAETCDICYAEEWRLFLNSERSVLFRIKHQKRGKKDQRSHTSPGGISNQQTEPEAGSNYQPGKLNGGPGKGT